MARGKIKAIPTGKNFGFISAPDEKSDVFFHCNDLAPGQSFSSLQRGTPVDFNFEPNPRKIGEKKAINVRAVEAASNRCNRVEPAAQAAMESTLLPYDFVPIDLDNAVTDTPVFHDGLGGGNLLSGEILCTLTCLTPFLPGNTQYKKQKADQGQLTKWGYGSVDKEKSIIEPLRLADGRVVVSGSALKGMIRHSLGALLSAPMERVAEHHYTYRPNLNHAKGRSAKLEGRPAVITQLDGRTAEVAVLPAQSAVFVHDASIASYLHRTYEPGAAVRERLDRVEIKADPRTGSLQLKPLRGRQDGYEDLDHYFYSYTGGIDGSGKLARAFKSNSGIHREALDPSAAVKKHSEKRTIRSEVLKHYRRTQSILADGTSGHLTKAHPLTGKLEQGVKLEDVCRDIFSAGDLKINQLIYVEIEVNEEGKLGEIRSFGHHYQYRWAYTSSIRESNGQTRDCLRPLDCEQATADSSVADRSPDRLSGARLLFGYVPENEIGAGAYTRMAGRIAINHGVSGPEPEFLGNRENGYCIPLRTLGQPRPSAYEFYLQQSEDESRPVTTYGDSPEYVGGALRGRKTYRHQVPTGLSDIKAEGQMEVTSAQGALARFVCAADNEFKFTIRFARLREWELGALLAVVQPQRLAPSNDKQEYAHKLGLGRPLGMGSVKIGINGMRVRAESSSTFEAGETSRQIEQDALSALCNKLDGVDWSRWLEALRLDPSRKKRLAYPSEINKKKGEPEIFGWHSKIRKKYSKLRRERDADWAPLRDKIKKSKHGVKN